MAGLAGAAGGVIGGLWGLAGAHMAQETTRELQRNQFTFQEHMSNTAYQRAMADIRKTGMNPILAFASGGSGASTPSGSAGQGAQPGGDPVGSGISAAKAASEIALLKAQKKKVDQERIESGSKAILNGMTSARAVQQMYVDQALAGLHGQTSAKTMHQTRYEAAKARQAELMEQRYKEVYGAQDPRTKGFGPDPEKLQHGLDAFMKSLWGRPQGYQIR